MSSFKDTFTRDQRKEPLLSYDANASLYFAATIIMVVLIPWSWNLIKNTFFPSDELNNMQFPCEIKKDSRIKFCGCSECAAKVDKMKKSKSSWSSRFSKSFFVQLLIVTLLWGVFYFICINLGSDKAIHAFDPFEILGISHGATDKEIKRAYRAMSLKWHPDKNPNNPQAEHMFMLISKAQLALTDEVAKKNYEKYGNPDGPTSMKIGIGLPPFLVAEENQIFVLIGFFLIILLVIPLVFISYFLKQRKYASNGVQVETLHLSASMITKETTTEDLPYFIAASAESRSLNIYPEDEEIINAISKKLPQHSKKKFTHPVVIRNYYLLIAHVYRLHDMLNDNMKKDLNKLIPIGFTMLQSILEIACIRGFHTCALACVEFRRMMVQAIGFKGDQFLQIPHFNKELIDILMKCRNPVKGLAEYCQLPDDEKKGTAEMTTEQQDDVKLCCKHVSDLEIYLEAETKGESEIAIGDIVSFTVHVVRRNLKDDEISGPVHAPFIDTPVFEKLHVFLFCDKEKESASSLVAYGSIKTLGRKEECVILAPVKIPGTVNYKVIVMSDAYRGIDKHASIDIKILTTEEAKRKVFVHEEDLELDKQPTLFEQMMGVANKNTDSDDEEEVVDK